MKPVPVPVKFSYRGTAGGLLQHVRVPLAGLSQIPEEAAC